MKWTNKRYWLNLVLWEDDAVFLTKINVVNKFETPHKQDPQLITIVILDKYCFVTLRISWWLPFVFVILFLNDELIGVRSCASGWVCSTANSALITATVPVKLPPLRDWMMKLQRGCGIWAPPVTLTMTTAAAVVVCTVPEGHRAAWEGGGSLSSVTDELKAKHGASSWIEIYLECTTNSLQKYFLLFYFLNKCFLSVYLYRSCTILRSPLIWNYILTTKFYQYLLSFKSFIVRIWTKSLRFSLDEFLFWNTYVLFH